VIHGLGVVKKDLKVYFPPRTEEVVVKDIIEYFGDNVTKQYNKQNDIGILRNRK